MDANFLVGTAVADITPPEGLGMIGGLNDARHSQGTALPLLVKAVVVEAAGRRLAFASFDLCVLTENIVRDALAKIEAETGISPSHVLWTCSHTHSGPGIGTGVENGVPLDNALPDPASQTWLGDAMDKFADCVKRADAARKPARPFLSRAFVRNGMANRRECFKGGVQTNIWLPPPNVQCLGSAAPVDPELGVLGFETEGALALLYNFACHANAAWGSQWHSDYPGVAAEQLKDMFVVYTPGACGDINPTTDVETIGGTIRKALEERRRDLFPTELGAMRKFVTLPYRAFDETTEPRLAYWDHQYFRDSFTAIKASGQTSTNTPIQAAHVGDVAFAAVPGELFVEHGLRLKRESPFPWTFPVELSGDWQGYLVTKDAWDGGGYESIPALTGRISPEGVVKMVDELVDMLHHLRRTQIFGRLFPREVEAKGGGRRVIRPLRGADAEALAAFYASVPAADFFHYCPHPLDQEHAAANAAKAEASPYYVCLVAETPDKAIGGYAWHAWSRGAEKSSFGICLRRDHQRLGVGRKLMAALLESAKLFGPPVMRLDVQPVNAGALALYASLGFKKIGENRRHAQGDLNYQMELRLANFQP